MTTQQIPLTKLLTARETIITFGVWFSITVFVLTVYPWSEFLSSWTITIPAGWAMYHISFLWLFPKALSFRFSFLFYIGVILIYCLTVFFVAAMFLSMFIEDEGFFLSLLGITLFILFFILAPGQWFFFKRLARSNEELFNIKKELGQTEANVDLLRSQINPHFLFNALNTLYGMAIQEKADRTSEAIEKLGSMMRFMLQENVQEKISLVRDLEYLNNFIALQRLRTDINPNIKIQIAIQQEVDPAAQIAPMLLIPFIENAFKHGISLREESHVRISLELKKSTLYFDVFNNKHERSENDPEKNSNGIGLVNVKQRLQLVYPGKHELVIRETTYDYFVHLVINLGQ
ncbi:MAG TPA: histidine kinase [Cyclobacteriaceae bacterium]|nr:histidine kinase [Cyclobacteriaceae bacterium]